ncbi:hypothetical protein HPB52_017727 [Rhipicephalus sanguineus]|uniref:Uncharacterized protein n=1 Tax=Rhipicephalus sanguineus TaxID=34632 RepID=A0A9D4YQL9_RHISA|nr:hypothetical protein HPB52_017727 [Rhipicephalus sanguineus]
MQDTEFFVRARPRDCCMENYSSFLRVQKFCVMTESALAFTLLGWTSASGRAPRPAAPYPASTTTTAAQSPAVALRLLWGASARTRAARSPADPPAGLSDDWSTRLSVAPRRTPSSREKPPTTPMSPTEAPQMRKAASSAATPTITLAVGNQPSVPQGLMEASPERVTTTRAVVRRKLLLPDDRSPTEHIIATSLEPHASSVVYESSSQARPRKAAQQASGEAASSPNVLVYASAFSEKLVAPDGKQANQQLPSRTVKPSFKSPRRTITIPYSVPQRAVVSGTNGQKQPDRHHIESSTAKQKQRSAAPGASNFVVRLPDFLHLPNTLVPAPSPPRSTKGNSALSYQPKRASFSALSPSVALSARSSPASYRRDYRPSVPVDRDGSLDKRAPAKDEPSYFKEFPYADDSSSYEENERHEPHGHGSEAAHAPYRRPLYTFPKPIDFGLSKMNQKGCKTTVKELKHVSKDSLGVAGSDLHSLFRQKRGAPSEPKMTSIIMTKECFFPEDPASNAGNAADIASPRGNHSPGSYRSPSSQRAYLSNYDPQSRSTHSTPTYNSYYPRPQYNRGWRSFASAPVFRTSKFPTSTRGHASTSFDDKAFEEAAPYASGRYDRENLGRRGLRGSSSTVFGDDARDNEGDSRDESSPYVWRNGRRELDKSDDNGDDDYGPRYRYGGRNDDSAQASGHKSRTRGPPPPKTSNRSFAFYRRDENPEKDHFVESYSTARRKTFKSDYDSDRDGFFE